jgi:hypothetical protein
VPETVHVAVDVRDGKIVGIVGGTGLKPITTEEYAAKLSYRYTVRRPNDPFVLPQPLFGPGLGVFVLNADGVFANLTLSRIDP